MYPERKKPDSRRVQETKRKIQMALLGLLQEKSIEQITVMEITERSQINRTSFYRYYLDVYDLYDSVVEAYAGAFQQIMPHMLMKLLFDNPVSVDDVMLDFLEQNRRIIECSVLNDSRMFQKLKAKNIASLKEMLHITADDTEINFILEFYVGGQMGLITYWLQHFDQITTNELLALMQKLVLQGPLTVLKEKVPQETFETMYQNAQPFHTDIF